MLRHVLLCLAVLFSGPLFAGIEYSHDGCQSWQPFQTTYNADKGKDYWPIGSVIVMERNASWTNRVVGGTEERQTAYKIKPPTLQRDDANGAIIYPKHVHKALRQNLGLANTSIDQDFSFNATQDFKFFG